MKSFLFTAITICLLTVCPSTTKAQNEGDDILRQIFIYCPGERDGLHAAYLDFDSSAPQTTVLGEWKKRCMSPTWQEPTTALGGQYGN